MSHARTHVVDATTETLLDVLAAWQNDIIWAPQALTIFQTIRSIYKAYAQTLDAPDHVWELEDKVKELERYLVVDLEVHIASRNGRTPFHLRRIYQHLERVTDLIGQHLITGEDGRRRFVGSPYHVKEFDHLGAELQSTFVEYGFCHSFEALYNIEEITRRLNGICNKLTKVEKVLSDPEGSTSTTIQDLKEAIAEQHGIQQAITEQNLGKIQGLYEKITDRIIVLENTISRERLQKDSEVFQRYVEAQKCLQNSVMHDMFYADPIELINEHNIHPGTRAWLLERVHRWFNSTNKRIFFLAAKKGAGKTAMASTICKLYGSNIMASYFFDQTQKNAQLNTLSGMLQSLSAEMCKAVPEYLAYLEAKFNNVSLSSQLGSSWQQTYNLLFKEPLVALYGSGPKSLYRRRLLVVDAVDELQESEWNNFKEFLQLFMSDLSPCISLFITVRARYLNNLLIYNEDLMEGVRLEDRAWVNRHIKDIEIYVSSSLGAILSGEDEVDAPSHAKADEHTLQSTVDNLLKCSVGRFDYAIEIMETFAKEMHSSKGQFLSSIKKAMAPMSKNHALDFDNASSDFASPFRAYRDKEGRSVAVRVMRQSMYPMDKSRVALIRGRHRINELQN